MAKEQKIFKSEERKSLADVSDFLHQLADRVAQGQIVLRQGEEELLIQLPQDVVLEVEVEEKMTEGRATKRKLELELEWYEGDAGQGTVELG
jgi:amphi-Trp domain-containing protein